MHLLNSSLSTNKCTFTNNSALYGGVISVLSGSSSTVISSTFSSNRGQQGGIICNSQSSLIISASSFYDNSAANIGGVIDSILLSSEIVDSIIDSNNAYQGGVLFSSESSYDIINCTIKSNSAYFAGGAISTGLQLITSLYLDYRDIHVTNRISITDESSFTDNITVNAVINIKNCTFRNNTAKYMGTITTVGSSIIVINCTFEYNIGSLFALSANITFHGYSKFENCRGQTSEIHNQIRELPAEGGAITIYQSNLLFTGVIRLLSNQASQGGALHAVGSTITISGQAIVSNNTAKTSTGGGIYLEQSSSKIFGNCHISHNHAMTQGGGIHASSSPISVYQPRLLWFSDNHAEIAGGGLYLDTNPKLNLFKYEQKSSMLITFHNNHAAYGGAVYVTDNTSSGCINGMECFIKSIALNSKREASQLNIMTMIFYNNTASNSGPNLYGGLFDRCILSVFTGAYTLAYSRIQHYSGVTYLKNISNIVLDSVSSLPVRVCFCDNERQPNCSYQPPTIKVMKGATFNVSLVAVDQVDHSVNANISSSLAYPGGGFSEGQQLQKVTSNCTDLKYNIFSPEDSEILTLFPNGPCGSSAPSARHVNITILNCNCPIGFEPSNSKPTTCECICDSKLSSYINDCNYTTLILV